jgi:2-polyprenyl-3-methyl-5-hydroxy-6-metoxy-1,4-benzoquinol methylase
VDRMTDYYRSADSYSEMLRGQQTDAFTPYIELFEQFANLNDSIIDVGCRVGTSTLLLREAGFNAIGIDVSERFLPSESGIFCTADFQNAEAFPSNKYLAVGALNVIEHIERPKDFLSEMVRVARPEGHIILMSHFSSEVQKLSETTGRNLRHWHSIDLPSLSDGKERQEL